MHEPLAFLLLRFLLLLPRFLPLLLHFPSPSQGGGSVVNIGTRPAIKDVETATASIQRKHQNERHDSRDEVVQIHDGSTTDTARDGPHQHGDEDPAIAHSRFH